jgi:hypothetical protein
VRTMEIEIYISHITQITEVIVKLVKFGFISPIWVIYIWKVGFKVIFYGIILRIWEGLSEVLGLFSQP